MRSNALRRAFHLDQEDPRPRDRYGRTKHGQSVLLARRLIEEGVRFVTVYDHQRNGQLANWDAHENVFGRHKNDLMPPADRAYAALIDDLAQRGCSTRRSSWRWVSLAGHQRSTRKPGATTGPTASRCCWPEAESTRGITHGASDKLGAYPERDG